MRTNTILNNIKFLFLLTHLPLITVDICVAQSTRALMSTDGFATIVLSYDDVGNTRLSQNFYIKDSTINGTEYLEFQNKTCESEFLRVDSSRVFRKNNSNCDEVLKYDYGLQINDTISKTFFLQPGGFMTFKYRVSRIDTIKLKDNKSRMRLSFVSEQTSDTLFWIEGLGEIQEYHCSLDSEGVIFLNNISELDCIGYSMKQTTSIHDQLSDEVLVYPNPTAGLLRFSRKVVPKSKLEVYSISGQLVVEFDYIYPNSALLLEGLEKGMKVLKIISPNSRTNYQKIIFL